MSLFRSIQAVTFDAGGTLIQPWPSVGHIYAEVARRHGFTNLSAEKLDRQFSAAWRKLKNFNHTREEWAALVDQTFAGASGPPPSRAFFPELYDRFAGPGAWHIYDDVLPALDALAAAGLQLAVVSNWDERLRPLLEQMGLAKYFETVVVSCEVGFPKPSPVIFEHAARRLGLPHGRILHVGDNLEADVRGAKSAGFCALLLDRKKERDGPEQIKSLRDLAGVVGC
ncbi:MAG TPA: HAD-IA family hydrolase [Verrucomicrobiae bacterium]|nr:HAD-IA family hydrolase [Verrucomicrobiae bacterium]